MMDWDEIVAQHGPLVWRTAYRLVGNEADAADVYQEAFAAALALSRREVVRSWPALLQRLATVQALDRIRRRAKDGARHGAGAELEFVAAASPEPMQNAQVRELADWLRETVTTLPGSQAEAFSLVCIEEMSHQEVAAQMSIEANHVAVLVHRARTRLRELLARREQTERT